MVVHSYRDLKVWQKAMDLAVLIYRLSESFPKQEQYGLTSLIRRAVVSIPSNIAEGRAKHSTRDFMRFVHIAYGSTAEVETQLILAHRLNYISSQEMEPSLDLCAEIGRMLNGLLNGLQQKLEQPIPLNADPRMLTPS